MTLPLLPDWCIAPPSQGSLNEQQTIAFVGTPVSGSYNLQLGTIVSASINYNDSNATIQSKINAIYTPATAVVSGGAPPTSLIVDFGVFSQTNIIGQMTPLNNSMVTSGGAPVQVTVAVTQASQAPATVAIDTTHTNNGWSLLEFPPFNMFNQWMNLVGQWIRIFNSAFKGENLFRNGGFDVGQRGGSGQFNGTSGYCVDGWIGSATGHALNWTQVRANSGSFTQTELVFICPGQNATDAYLKQRIESTVIGDVQLGSYLTAQVTVNGLNGTPTIQVNYANSADNFSSVTTAIAATNLQPSTGGTVTFAYTFQVTANMYNGIEVIFDFGANINTGGISFASADCSVNRFATAAGLCSFPPFPQVRPIGVELANCQRYLKAYGPYAGTFESIGVGFINDATHAFFQVETPGMRANPTMTYSNLAHFEIQYASGANNTITALATEYNSVDKSLVEATVTGSLSAAGTAAVLITQSALGQLLFSAEL